MFVLFVLLIFLTDSKFLGKISDSEINIHASDTDVQKRRDVSLSERSKQPFLNLYSFSIKNSAAKSHFRENGGYGEFRDKQVEELDLERRKQERPRPT